MKNSAFILGWLKNLLEFADARANITIFERQGDEEKIIKDCRVYEILTDKEFLNKYQYYAIVGLNLGLVNNVLIQKEEV